MQGQGEVRACTPLRPPTLEDARPRRFVCPASDARRTEKNFRDFKSDTQDEFKALNTKLDEVRDLVADIRMVMAKWLGGGIVAMAVLQFLVERFVK